MQHFEIVWLSKLVMVNLFNFGRRLGLMWFLCTLHLRNTMLSQMFLSSYWSRRNVSWSIHMRNPLSRVEMTKLEALPCLVAPIRPSYTVNVPVWKLFQSSMFSVDFYKFLNFNGMRCPFSKCIWRHQQRKKVKVFLWLVLYSIGSPSNRTTIFAEVWLSRPFGHPDDPLLLKLW